MSSDDEGEASAATESEEEAPEPAPSETEQELNPVSKRKKAAPIERDFTEINRWSRDDHSEDEIYAYIRAQLAAINKDAGLPATIAGMLVCIRIATSGGVVSPISGSGPQTKIPS